MVAKIKSELLPLTRELAIRFSEMKQMPGERALKDTRLKYFNTKLRTREFQSPNWAVAVVDGVEYRADGQHTSRTLATCPIEQFPIDLKVTINTYALDSLDERAIVFELFDNPVSARSNTDKLGVYVADFSDLDEVDRAFLSRAAHGIDYYYRDLGKNHEQENQPRVYQTRDHGLYFTESQHREFGVWLYTWHNAEHAWMLMKPGIVAEIFADWVVYPAMATRFWGEVLTESNPDPDDETRELSRTFKEWSRRQPRIRQDKFRARAKKTWDRYKRLAATPSKPNGASAENGGAPPLPGPASEVRLSA